MSASSLSLPLLTTICCCYRQTSQWVRHRYHTILVANVTAVMLFVLSCGLWDQFNLPPELLCPSAFYACPHHLLDVNAINTTWYSLAFINIFSACLVKYKVAANLLVVVIFLTGALAGYHPNVLAAPSPVVHLVVTTLVIAVGTFYVGYKGEQSFRQSLISRVLIKRRNEAFAAVLTKMLPPRLLHESFTVPLLEHFSGVSVMFCSFDKTAVGKLSPKHFFNEIEDIFAIFDDLVEQSGCFKLEQVGEDYVVVTGNVMSGDSDDDLPAAHREACVKIANLGKDLVEIGNRHVSPRTRKPCGDVFQFRAGIHFGQLSAGILGRSRKFYRIFGDTVVTAARMCQSTVPGTVQISHATHELMGFMGPSRKHGRLVDAKGKGHVMAYVLEEANAPTTSRTSSRSPDLTPTSPTSPKMLSKRNSSSSSSRSLSYRRRAMLGFVELPNFSDVEGDTACDEDIEIILDEKQSRALLSLYQERTDSSKVLTEKISRLSHEAVEAQAQHDSRSLDVGKTGDANGQTVVPLSFDPWTGRFKDKFQEQEYCQKFEHRLRLTSMRFINCSRVMALILFTSVATLGTNSGWAAPAALGGRNGYFIDTDDVKITLWMGVLQVLLMILSLLIPPALARRADGSYMSSAAQCTIFGCGCVVAMACTPSVLSLGVPMAFLAQVACAHMDIIFAMASAVPVMTLCFAEAYYSGKLVTWVATALYAVFLIGTLAIVLYHQAKNEAGNRRDWRASQELRIEKEVMEIILLDMLPKKFAIQLLNNVEMQNEEGKSCKAIVLHGDLRGYTGLSEELGPHEIAMVMHGMWCVFDALVQKHKVHKMDTVGDAFIVTGLVEDDDSNLLEQACGMADLARDMIVALRNISAAIDSKTEWWKTFESENAGSKKRTIDDMEIVRRPSQKEAPIKGKIHPQSLFKPTIVFKRTSSDKEPENWDQKLKMRIGIDVGMVVAGVIGKLQPRFHMHGPVLYRAQVLEQRCQHGGVLISQEMARILQIKSDNSDIGHQLPFPMKTYVFPHLGEPPVPPPQVSSGILHSFLTFTGLKIPSKMRQDEMDQLKGSKEVQQAENILEQLEQFSYLPIHSMSERSTRSRQVQVHVDMQQMPEEMSTITFLKHRSSIEAKLPVHPTATKRRRSLQPAVNLLSPVIDAGEYSFEEPGSQEVAEVGNFSLADGEDSSLHKTEKTHKLSFTFDGAGTLLLGQPLRETGHPPQNHIMGRADSPLPEVSGNGPCTSPRAKEGTPVPVDGQGEAFLHLNDDDAHTCKSHFSAGDVPFGVTVDAEFTFAPAVPTASSPEGESVESFHTLSELGRKSSIDDSHCESFDTAFSFIATSIDAGNMPRAGSCPAKGVPNRRASGMGGHKRLGSTESLLSSHSESSLGLGVGVWEGQTVEPISESQEVDSGVMTGSSTKEQVQPPNASTPRGAAGGNIALANWTETRPGGYC